MFFRQTFRSLPHYKFAENYHASKMKNVLILTEQITKHVCVYPTEGTRQKQKFSAVSWKKLKCLISHITLVFCFLVSKSSNLRFAKIYKFSSSFIN